MKYDVFISYKNSGKNGDKTPDAEAARQVHAALKARGISTFFSEVSLVDKGQGNFSKSIEAALDSAQVLVLVGSCREHIESRWVEAEWDSFLQDVRSGNKEGELFILNCGDLKPAELPLFLRRQQMFGLRDLGKLVEFVGSAMTPQTSLSDLIELSLHCLRPEKHEDKIYLMTVQPGADTSTRNVAAHWGPRAARRLSSQVKAINVPVEDAAQEVIKARQEKLRGGYRPAPHAKLLTSEARAFLAASLGVADTAGSTKKTGKVAVRSSKASASRNGSAKPASGSVPVKSSLAEKTAPKKVPATVRNKAIGKGEGATGVGTKSSATPKASAGSASKPNGQMTSKLPGKPDLKARTVCISGRLPSGRKKAEYQEPLRAAGLQLVDDVTATLKYLVVADPEAETAKLAKAKKLGVRILSEKGLAALIRRNS